MFVVISYDVVNDRRRSRIHKTLTAYGKRVQYSVFECELSGESFKRLREKLLKLYAEKEDNVRFYFLDEDAVKRIETAGVGLLERVSPVRITD
jgi:CRISPR-associated protein Cas2